MNISFIKLEIFIPETHLESLLQLLKWADKYQPESLAEIRNVLAPYADKDVESFAFQQKGEFWKKAEKTADG